MFLALLPMLLAFMGRLQGLHSQALVDFSVINKYYIFQVDLQAFPWAHCSASGALSTRLLAPLGCR